MTGTKFNALLAAAGLALAGCSSVKTQVDTGPIKASTFSFVSTSSKPAPASANNITAVYTMVQDAITHTLAAKGVQRLPSGGQVTVAFLIIAGDNVSTTALSDYFGYSDDADALLAKVHKAEAVQRDRRDYFQAGTLVIDLVDPKTSKLLWRSTMQRDILRNITPDVRAARLQEVVDASLSNLKIQP